tara:strand:- start:213 stop:599 length:387 start_codon:yes stop_codon:yes gene_type:complete
MNSQKVLKIASIFGVLAVVIGAFGAHGMERILIENNRVETFETAVQYHFYHTIALLTVSVFFQNKMSSYLKWSAYLFIVGIVVFSGSLYVLSLTNITILGAITPFGGLSFIGGWIALFLSAKEQNFSA